MGDSVTKYPDLFGALSEVFDSQEVRVRSQAGRQLHYITARTAMNRLDMVLGPENWWDDYDPRENSVICRITIRLPDGSTLTKCDAGGYAGMADSGDDDKSGFSDAFKRASVKFGIARYLYRDGVAHYGQGDDGSPTTVPVNVDTPTPPPTPSPAATGSVPRSGRALFAWAKEQEKDHQINLVNHLNGWAKQQGLPGRMVDWTPEQVALGHAEACHRLGLVPTSPQAEQQSQQQAAPAHVPDGSWPQPQAGPALFNELKRLETEHGRTFIDPVIKWAESHGVRTKMATWTGELLHDAWAYADSLRPKPASSAAIQLRPSQAACVDAARGWYKQVHGRDADRATLAKTIADLHENMFGGEVMGSFRDYGDDDRLDQMARSFDEDRKEAADADDIPF